MPNTRLLVRRELGAHDPRQRLWHWGVRAYAPNDLYNWQDRGRIIPPVLEDIASPLHPAQKMDRPHIVFNERTGKFVW